MLLSFEYLGLSRQLTTICILSSVQTRYDLGQEKDFRRGNPCATPFPFGSQMAAQKESYGSGPSRETSAAGYVTFIYCDKEEPLKTSNRHDGTAHGPGRLG